MKLKGISFWEQNVEKIFLGVVGVGVLGALGYQYVVQSTAVKVGKDMVAPEKSFEPVSKAARELKGKLEATDPKLPEVPQVNLADRYEQLVTGGVAPVKKVMAFGKATRLNTTGVVEGKGDTLFAGVVVPAPGPAFAHAFRSTISPFELAAHPELKTVLPPDQPFDKASASVEAVFDGTALKASFENDPDGLGPIEKLLSSWWRETDIIGVELERQQMGSDGSWGQATAVAPMPGRLDLIGDMKKKVKTMGDLPQVLGMARVAADQVQRVPYYATISGVDWEPPMKLAEGGGGPVIAKDERTRLTDKIAEIEKKYASVKAQFDKQQADKAKAANNNRNQQPAGGGGAGGGKGRMSSGGGSEGQPSAPTKSPLESSMETLAIQYDKAKKDLEAFDQKAAAAGATKPAAATNTPDGKAAPLPLLENPKVQVWTHDVSVEAGKTYRYRLRIAVNNPLFGRQASLKPEQAAMATDPLSRSEWSEWSEPVTVDPSEFYFITSASERDITGPTRASAELYKFYYGYYRLGTVTVEPGDNLAAEMKLPEGLKIFDMTKLAAFVPAQPQAQPEVAIPAPGGGGAGKGRLRTAEPQVGDPRQDRESGRTPSSVTPPPTGTLTSNTPPADGTWKPAPKSMKMAVDAMLLDVGPVALAAENKLGAKQEARTQAFLRVSEGAIEVRLPSVDVADAAHTRLKKNAAAGEAAGKPKDPEAPGAIPQIPLPPPPGTQVPRTPANSGGGGGAGGG